MKKVKACILRTAGTNCDKETAFAFEKAGSETEFVHVNQLLAREKNINDFHILALPGGFSYGDDAGAGRILANELRFKLIDDITRFIRDGKLIIGICNGFQILVKSGLLPGGEPDKPAASLIINDSNKFEDRWVYLKPEGRCVWTKDMDEAIYLPVAHGEGKFVNLNSRASATLKKNKQIVFKYCASNGKPGGYPDNPNGSEEDIAGITDKSGRILGLMPHPERHISYLQHPRRLKRGSEGDGMKIFRNGVDYAKRYL